MALEDDPIKIIGSFTINAIYVRPSSLFTFEKPILEVGKAVAASRALLSLLLSQVFQSYLWQ